MPIIRAVPLASGSKGNSLFVEADGVRLLVDAGLSCRQIELRLRSIDVEPATIDAILVTHEHIDHVAAIPLFSTRYQVPVYASPKLGARSEVVQRLLLKIEKTVPIYAGRDFSLGALRIHPFSISHDAVDPFGFRFECNGAAVALAADLGVVTRLVCDRLAGCQAIFCESNHDPKMLSEGPYPMRLKRRITGNQGHLSNTECRKLVENIYHDQLETLVLAHLSETNNTPRLAYDAMKAFLDQIDSKTDLRVALQDKVGTPVEIG